MLGLYEQVLAIARFALERKIEERVLSIDDADEQAKRRFEWRMDPLRLRVDSPYTGARYAAFEVGKTIVLMGGFKKLAEVVDVVEAEDPKAAEWLERVWDDFLVFDAA